MRQQEVALSEALRQNAAVAADLQARHDAIGRVMSGTSSTATHGLFPMATDFLNEHICTAWLLQEQTRCAAAVAALQKCPPFFRAAEGDAALGAGAVRQPREAQSEPNVCLLCSTTG